MKSLFLSILLLASFALNAAAEAPKQVLAILSVKTPVNREQLMKVMPQEVRDTVQLYLDGKIIQWYGRGDGKGVVFILSCQTVEEAKALTDALPLIKDNLAEFSFMPIGPLTPLRMLLPTPAGK